VDSSGEELQGLSLTEEVEEYLRVCPETGGNQGTSAV
jgi:hypothetical protein